MSITEADIKAKVAELKADEERQQTRELRAQAVEALLAVRVVARDRALKASQLKADGCSIVEEIFPDCPAVLADRSPHAAPIHVRLPFSLGRDAIFVQRRDPMSGDVDTKRLCSPFIPWNGKAAVLVGAQWTCIDDLPADFDRAKAALIAAGVEFSRDAFSPVPAGLAASRQAVPVITYLARFLDGAVRF